MTTILAFFITSLAFSLVLTPMAGWFCVRYGAVDTPNERKVHIRPTARCGGVSIFLSFLLTLVLVPIFSKTNISDLLVLNSQTSLILLGAFIVFGTGVVDDFHRLGSRVKFIFQILGATSAFFGGLQICNLDFLGLNIQLGVLSYVVTVFWFVLLINAINLIDGLDGLAAGITFFACAVMIILSIMLKNYLMALLFAALGGSVLGFLRYNFNPASIFLGDGGSYFLGYSIAALSIMSSIKSQMSTVMLIPLVGLGIPLFDTLFSPVRRFLLGKDMFCPDKGHVHHKLLAMGLSTRKVVLIIYGISVVLCAFSLIMVNLRNEQVGLFLIILTAASLIFLRKLRYFEYLTAEKIFGWLNDLTDEAGIRKDRRTFLSMQMHLANSQDTCQLWKRLIQTAEKIDLNTLELDLNPKVFNKKTLPLLTWENSNGGEKKNTKEKVRYLRLEVPIGSNGASYATLRLSKSIQHGNGDRFILQRTEHLRRTLTGILEKLATRSSTCPEVVDCWNDSDLRILKTGDKAQVDVYSRG